MKTIRQQGIRRSNIVSKNTKHDHATNTSIYAIFIGIGRIDGRVFVPTLAVGHRVEALSSTGNSGRCPRYIFVQEPMSTVFKPVSPPPYLNGGPVDYLSWVIEPAFNYIEMIEDRLPNPIDDENEWNND